MFRELPRMSSLHRKQRLQVGLLGVAGLELAWESKNLPFEGFYPLIKGS